MSLFLVSRHTRSKPLCCGVAPGLEKASCCMLGREHFRKLKSVLNCSKAETLIQEYFVLHGPVLSFHSQKFLNGASTKCCSDLGGVISEPQINSTRKVTENYAGTPSGGVASSLAFSRGWHSSLGGSCCCWGSGINFHVGGVA